MRPKSRYDLNAAIGHWQSELAAQPNLTEEVRRELEAHLRDAIAGFQQRGLNDEESFWLACKRVGQPAHLGEEFVKADPAAVWRERVFWALVILLVLQIWNVACAYLWRIIILPAPITDYFPAWLERLRGSVFYTLAYVIPIFAFVAFLARGGLNHLIRSFQFLFPSRFRLILAAFILVLALHFFDKSGGLLWIGMGRSEGVWTTTASGNWISQYCTDLLFTESLPLTFVVLITWLMPPQNQTTPKRA